MSGSASRSVFRKAATRGRALLAGALAGRQERGRLPAWLVGGSRRRS